MFSYGHHVADSDGWSSEGRSDHEVLVSPSALLGNMHLYNMHPTLLSKDVFLDRNIPQFRLVSLNGHRDPMTVALALQTAACVLIDGGIVVVDGSNTATTRTAVEGYFRRFGSVSMAPLLDVGDKLYRSVYSELETHLHKLYLYKQVGRPGCVCRHTGSPFPFIQGLLQVMQSMKLLYYISLSSRKKQKSLVRYKPTLSMRII